MSLWNRISNNEECAGLGKFAKKDRKNNWEDNKSNNIPCSFIFIFLIKLPDINEYSGSSTWKVMILLNIAVTNYTKKEAKEENLWQLMHEMITKL